MTAPDVPALDPPTTSARPITALLDHVVAATAESATLVERVAEAINDVVGMSVSYSRLMQAARKAVDVVLAEIEAAGVDAPVQPADARIDEAGAALCAAWIDATLILPAGVGQHAQFDVLTEDGRDVWRGLVRVVDSALGTDPVDTGGAQPVMHDGAMIERAAQAGADAFNSPSGQTAEMRAAMWRDVAYAVLYASGWDPIETGTEAALGEAEELIRRLRAEVAELRRMPALSVRCSRCVDDVRAAACVLGWDADMIRALTEEFAALRPIVVGRGDR